MSHLINVMTCENKKKGGEHFKFDQMAQRTSKQNIN